MQAGERERTQDGEMSLQPLGSGTQQTVGRGFAGPVRMQRVDRVALATWPALIGIDKAGTDVDEVAAVDLARSLEERYGGGDIQPDEIEPSDLRWAHSTGCAMDDGSRLKVQNCLHQARGIRDIDLLKVYIREVREERIVQPSHQYTNRCCGMHQPKAPDDVIPESSGGSCHENSL
jgi:hypothetical protein